MTQASQLWQYLAISFGSIVIVLVILIIYLAAELRKCMEANIQMQIRHLQHAKELQEVNTALTESIVRASDKPFIRPPRPSEVQPTEQWFTAKPTVNVKEAK